MNKILRIITLLIALSASNLHAAIGCMDNSQHLKQNYDTKAYHYVKCDCVCRRMGPGTNRCARCGHLMVPHEEEYVENTHLDAHPNKSSSMDTLMVDPNVKLKEMLVRHSPNRATAGINSYTASRTAIPNRD